MTTNKPHTLDDGKDSDAVAALAKELRAMRYELASEIVPFLILKNRFIGTEAHSQLNGFCDRFSTIITALESASSPTKTLKQVAAIKALKKEFDDAAKSFTETEVIESAHSFAGGRWFGGSDALLKVLAILTTSTALGDSSSSSKVLKQVAQSCPHCGKGL